MPEYTTNQSGHYYKELSNAEIMRKMGRTHELPIDISRSYTKKLKTNLIVAPMYQAYSLIVQYMNNWFYKKFPDDFFKHKYLDLSHIMDQMNHYTIREIIKSNKPSAHIVVEDDTDYNRNNIDLHNLGLTLYNNRARYKDAFYIDRDKDVYISMCFMQLRMEFSFTIRVNTKSVQDDVFALCDMAFRAGGSYKNYIDIDYPIPHELIGQIACDAGMCNDDGKYEVNKMLSYFNQRSKLALLYKFNTATGNMEYFLRIPRVLIHLRPSRIQKQQGQMKNMIYTDFGVTFTVETFMPAIKFFAYYSLTQREHLESYTMLDRKSMLFGLTTLNNIPNKDEHGWPWEFRSTYTLSSEEELQKLKNKELITIDIDPIFIGELREAMEASKAVAISPAAFVNIKAYNYLTYVPLEVNWQCMKIQFTEPLESQEIHFVIYLNKEYMHKTIGDLKMFRSARLRPNDNRIGPQMELGTKVPNI